MRILTNEQAEKKLEALIDEIDYAVKISAAVCAPGLILDTRIKNEEDERVEIFNAFTSFWLFRMAKRNGLVLPEDNVNDRVRQARELVGFKK
jgi:hypothetical protein